MLRILPPSVERGQVKSLIALSLAVLHESGAQCGVSTPRDGKTITSRTKHEGDSFLTIALPAFAQDFEEAIEQGQIGSNHFAGFQRHGGLPRFLGGFLRRVFDAGCGTLLSHPDVECISAIRQICYLQKKVPRECTRVRTRAALRQYVDTDSEVHDSLIGWMRYAPEYARAASMLFLGALSHVDQAVHLGEMLPKHGPGNTAEKLTSNERWTIREWTDRLQDVFPADHFAFPNAKWLDETLDGMHFREPGDERPVRVVTVPKTLKTPRVIAIEPSCMQYMQQALKDALVPALERDSLIGGMLGFTDQIPNQDMAQRGSATGDLATLDLSEASDRVSMQHVMLLFTRMPALRRAMAATRSTKAAVPGFGEIPLAKFASMGSAVCFPAEAMVFLTIVFLGIAHDRGVPLSRGLIREMRGKVRVYGDDIIVPTDHAPSVVRYLELFGLKVNRRKSFWNSLFRESCGGDFYNGRRVTPIRLGVDISRQRLSATQVASLVEFRNHMYLRGYMHVAELLDQRIRRILPVYPVVPEGTPGLGRVAYDGFTNPSFDPKLHRPVIKVCDLRSRSPRDPLDDRGALMKFFTLRGSEPLGEESFIRAGRPRAAALITRWVPVTM